MGSPSVDEAHHLNRRWSDEIIWKRIEDLEDAVIELEIVNRGLTETIKEIKNEGR